jgi:cytochrome oxidase Cu insertion factor (SCO1/SenC/PrrC family)
MEVNNMGIKLHTYWLATGVLAIVTLAFLSGCAQQQPPAPTPAPAPTAPAAADWMDIELTDVVTGGKFRISDFKGKPVLLESFAVWCPTCLAQQKEIKKVKESHGDDIIHISLDTDPNEDAAKVKEHLEKNGLDWYFAVAPVELTRALIDEFGVNVVAAPRAPVVLICEDQSARFLRSGIKSGDELVEEVEKGCQ